MNNLSDIVTDEKTKLDIKILILETFGDALIESKSVEDMADRFRKKVLAL
jgi:hypothetical protein